MNRREILRRGALASAVALAGCTDALDAAEFQPPAFDGFDEESVDLPVERTFDEAAEAVRAGHDATPSDPDAFVAVLEDGGLRVESLEAATADGEPVLELAYVDERYADRGAIYGLGLVSGGFAALLDGGDAPDVAELDASMRDPSGRPFGTFHVAVDLAERYLAGDLTAAEYAGEVADTLESDS